MNWNAVEKAVAKLRESVDAFEAEAEKFEAEVGKIEARFVAGFDAGLAVIEV